VKKREGLLQTVLSIWYLRDEGDMHLVVLIAKRSYRLIL